MGHRIERRMKECDTEAVEGEGSDSRSRNWRWNDSEDSRATGVYQLSVTTMRLSHSLIVFWIMIEIYLFLLKKNISPIPSHCRGLLLHRGGLSAPEEDQQNITDSDIRMYRKFI